jgi:hypothetical protein
MAADWMKGYDPVWVSTMLRVHGGFTEENVLAPEQEIEAHFGLRIWPPDAWFFRVAAPDYHMSLRVVNGDRIVFRRNDVELSAALMVPSRLRFGWKADTLFLRTGAPAGVTWEKKEVQTVRTLPPVWTLDYLDERSVKPANGYRTAEDFWNEVRDQLKALNARIRDVGWPAGFYDEVPDSDGGIRRVPRDEPLLTRHIELLLRHVRKIKGMQIMPEVQNADGRLDFLFTGILESGQEVRIAVEFKVAHHTKLADGLFQQLPEYMNRVRADAGIFAVLDFGPEYPTPGLNKEPWSRHNEPTLKMKLPTVVLETGMPIRAVVIDVSKGISPSKKRAAKPRKAATSKKKPKKA